MTQLSFWLAASLLLVVAVIALTRRVRRLSDRVESEHQRARQVSELHLASIEALALAIDAKDQTARNHIRRVRIYAVGVARALGLSEPDVQGVQTAAILHDVGKLAVPEHILVKPGPHTAEELQKVRIHPQVGADIIAAVPFPYPVAPLILGHHERWDGRGYPSGLEGEQIPLGARILTVVDYYDTLTSDRAYGTAMPEETATALLQQEAGKALDPAVVDAFLRVLPELRAAVKALDKHDDRPQVAPTVPSGDDEPPSTPKTSRSSVFDDIALANREIYALYQIAQTMGTSLGVSDTMALISSKLTNLVPFSACALFLAADGEESLYCRFATGTDSELIQQLALKSGHGLTGWVARNRRPLVNARPSADLEAAGSNLPTALQSALVCPLIYGDRLIGTLAVYHTTASFYRDDHRRLLDRVCEQAAAVIHNSMVFEETQEASLTDALTGLPNTRFMFMHLTRELSRAERLNSEVSLMVTDLNDFKEINDTFGHHVGDLALREVAQMLRAAIRPYDICIRYAGDEFIVVLAGCGRTEAENKRLELKQAIDQIAFEPTPGRRLPLSISAGAAVFPHDGDTYESLLAKADSRMYADKSSRKKGALRHAGRGASVMVPTDVADTQSRAG